jgi:LmbE family N-acetylglucosaminyl deacetylase
MRTHSAKSRLPSRDRKLPSRDRKGAFLALLLCLFPLPPAFAQSPFSGTPAIEQSLEKLTVLGSVLMIAAHPDDENTAILAYYARGRHMRTGYLSLTRGEGGQNLIGPEQGDLLGLIRSHELLAARQIDGAEQFFTRAIDFGYSKTPEETFEKWGHERVLSDVVWVIRRFRPDVVILRFSGTPKDGHGQHQVSAIVGKEAFFAAGDPTRFPEQLKIVQPWKARRLMFNSFSFTREMEKEAAATPGRIEVDTGAFNPVLGVSYSQIAGMSRSMHRSQGMGATQRPGPSKQFLVPVAGDALAKDAKDVFDSIDTTWERLPGGAEAGHILEEAVRTFEPDHPERTIPLLLKAHPLIAAIAATDAPWAREKLVELNEAIALCAGLWLDANADNYAVVPGATVEVSYTALNRSSFPMALDSLTLEGMGVESHAAAHDPAQHAALGLEQPVNAQLQCAVPADQPYSQPFWLREPKQGDTYTISDQRMVGLPDDPPLLNLRFGIEAGGVAVDLVRPVRHRYVDRVDGEQTRALTVVPPVALNLPQDVVLFPNGDARKVEIEVRAGVPKVAGDVRVALDAGWSAEPVARPFEQAQEGQQQPLAFEVKPAPGPDPPALLRGVARLTEREAGREIAVGMLVISHPPLPPLTVFPPAVVKLVRADVRVTAHKIGYVMGAGDEMPEAIRQLGCEVTLLSASDLEQRDLSEFDAIVTGVRAYNTRPDLRVNLPRLLDYVRNGGKLIDQYNVMDGNLVPMGPYPFKIGHDRITVEEAPVKFTNLSNPLLSKPNEITQKDFEGWVQERGLYFASEWDPRYQTVLESHDPGEKPLAGGMLYTRYGKGVYIFSGYAWFRELPAGVPGAYRLFANMLSK